MLLPQPEPEALQLSQQLEALLRNEIDAAGPISFARFMQRVLYEPGLGYYMSGLSKFGADGDFVTAPEISPVYSRCLARQCMDVMQNIPNASILEFGAGTGTMASEILLQLQKHHCLPEHYYILELSADLQQRQRQTLQEKVPELMPQIKWVYSLRDLSIDGVVLANEVLDAMPVERFVKHASSINRVCVDWNKSSQSFCQIESDGGEELQQVVKYLEKNLQADFPEAYCSEINLQLKPWFNSLSDCLQVGVALIIDYGYPRAKYYMPERSMGTLMCHYRHRAHDEPLLWVGLQDITAHVDFTAVAEAAEAATMEVLAFAEQVRFLLDCGVESLLAESMQSAELPAQLNLIHQLKKLVLPGQMGELFKVMAVAKQYNHPLAGFSKKNDQRHRL
ncbi:MAG: SAM-dependent methyltransferase [Gammaproteobacteria bacterium]|nr:SAM-dependent methyltransferase [Gammaproteobacteria bacterium]